MKFNNITTLAILFALTILTSIAFWLNVVDSWIVFAIIGLSAIKFLLVAFQFMELKKAHSAWKAILSGLLFIYVALICMLLM